MTVVAPLIPDKRGKESLFRPFARRFARRHASRSPALCSASALSPPPFPPFPPRRLLLSVLEEGPFL